MQAAMCRVVFEDLTEQEEAHVLELPAVACLLKQLWLQGDTPCLGLRGPKSLISQVEAFP